MTLSQDLADLAVALKLGTDRQMDAALDRIIRAWGVAWQELVTEWEAALQELIDQADDRWPSRATILRSQRALTALAHTAERLQNLAEQTGLEVVGDLPGLLALAQDHQWRMIGAQFPLEYALNWSQVPVATRALDAIVARTTRQITALTNPIPAEVTAVIKSTLIKGIALGESPRETAADMLHRIGDRFALGRVRAENIARTEMVDAYRDAARQSRHANSDVLAGWMWICALNSDRTCLSCIAMHGTVHPVDEPGPNDHQSGRCTGAPVVKTWRELGIDMDEPDPLPVVTGPEWFEGLTAAQQLGLMGRKRFDAWKAGTYPPELWSVTRTTKGWRDSQVVGPVPA